MMEVYTSQTGGILELGLIKEEELRGEDQQVRKHTMEEDSKDLMRKEDRIQLITEGSLTMYSLWVDLSLGK